MQHEKLPEVGSVTNWLRIADGDLYVARMQPSEHMLVEIICYHAQQAAEKSVKAVLTYYNLPVPRTHSIEKLLVEAAKAIDIPALIRTTAFFRD